MDDSSVFTRWHQCARHLIMLPWAHPSAHLKQHLDWFSRLWTAKRVTTLHNGPPFPPQTCPIPWESRSLVPWAYTSQQKQRHLDQFNRFCRGHYSDRLTDHATLSVTIGRIYSALQCSLKIIISLVRHTVSRKYRIRDREIHGPI